MAAVKNKKKDLKIIDELDRFEKYTLALFLIFAVLFIVYSFIFYNNIGSFDALRVQLFLIVALFVILSIFSVLIIISLVLFHLMGENLL